MFIDDLNQFKVASNTPFAVNATAVTTDALFIGPGGVAYDSLYLTVLLTTAFTAGSLTSVTLQTATDQAFTTPITLQVNTIPASIDQTKANFLWQQNLPLNTLGYVRLILTPTGTGAGGQIAAVITEEAPLR